MFFQLPNPSSYSQPLCTNMAPRYGASHLLQKYRFCYTGFFYLLAYIVGLYIIYILASIVYELYFSPLSKIPGRKSWIAFPLLRHVAALRGNLDSEILDIHEKYGDIVRLGPNEVSFTTADAWQDIFGHGHRQLPKVVRWKKNSTPNILFTDNDAYHTRYRKALAYGFSDKALRQQEPLIKVYVDLLIEKLKDVASSTSKTDMVRWYNLTTFDVIGDLSFGQSFGGLQNTDMHEWITNIFLFTKFGMFTRLANAYPLIGAVISIFTPKFLFEAGKRQESFARITVTKRINNTQQHGRSDFVDSMLRHKGDGDELSFEEIVSNANALIFAGSETTATLLSGATYWLLKTPQALKKAIDEVRTQFETEEEITFISTANKLPYMVACLEEALRIYPPVATQLPRRTLPGAPTRISDIEVPPNVSSY